MMALILNEDSNVITFETLIILLLWILLRVE
jgi:hypothetical protein